MAMAHDDAAGADRSCRQAEDNIAALLARARGGGTPVFHVHHRATDPADPFHADAAGSAVQPVAAPASDEPVVIKTTSSGFASTDLEQRLRDAGIKRLILCGATANHCVESTTRSACDLGFETIYVSDAVWAYGVTGPDGVLHKGDAIHSVVLATLDGEIASVRPTATVLTEMRGG
ncbi:MAG: isochorismatase [Rhodospirillaceae bacterium TMED140]|nr:isochorismatase [Rhodospirillaceae bacterium]OUX70431.1 MAG: isochorismatase [Rhodospirillaceae bacterium TMED140]